MSSLRLESSIPSKMAGFEGLYEERYCYFFIIHAIRRFFTLPQSVATAHKDFEETTRDNGICGIYYIQITSPIGSLKLMLKAEVLLLIHQNKPP